MCATRICAAFCNLKLPFTDLSSPTVMLPLPEALVFTGGTSSAPVILTCKTSPPPIVAQPANRTTPPNSDKLCIHFMATSSIELL
jgi:hypothetical protein